MALRQIKPALQQSQGRSKPWSGASLVNAFSEKGDGDKAADFAIMAIPGLSLLHVVGNQGIRGMRLMGDILYIVAGQQLYSLTSGGALAAIGAVQGTAPVRMADNGAQLAIAATPNGYVLSGGVLQQPAGLPQVTDVAYIDGYFVWTIYGTGQAAYSAIGEGLTYDGLDIVSAEGAPDGLLGLIVDHREVHFFGSSTIEIFYNSGGSDNAFERQGNAFIERGTLDRDSIAKVDNSVQFVGEDRVVYRLDGYSPMRISTHAIEYRLSSITYARAFTYTQEGHKFYGLTTDNGTFVYDLATGAWHERKSYGMGWWRVGHVVSAWGRLIAGDIMTGNIYVMSLDVMSENDEPISVEIGLPTIDAGRARVTMYALEVYMETGVGTNDGQGSDPQIMMRYSDDGGRTYSSELWRGLGRIGEYRTRAVWRSLGQFRQRQISLSITDPVRRLVMSYFADIR